MRAYLHDDLSDAVVSRRLDTTVSQRWTNTADLLAYLASFDERQLYLPAGYPSMYAYCVEKLHFLEDTAVRRIHAARVAKQFPICFPALALGRIHVTALLMLAPYLTSQNAAELIEAASHKGRSGIQQVLAERFPKPEMLIDAVISPVRDSPPASLPAPVRVEAVQPDQSSPAPVRVTATATAPRATAVPASASRLDLHVRIDKSTHDKLRRAQDLLSHALPSGDVAQVLDRALDALIERLEKRKCAATEKPGRARGSARARHIPAAVKRAVWRRDQGQCTFVSEDGHRCKSRRLLEYDHADPVARGGEATVDRMRLRCRGHNQYEAERVFGARFMQEKRREAAERKQIGARMVPVSA